MKSMDEAEKRLSATRWTFAEQDRKALEELTRRIVEAARHGRLLTYGDLVVGVTFHLSTVNDGKPFQIDPSSWSELHRKILGDFLGCIGAHSYTEHKVLVSAIVVGKEEQCPSEPFFKWAQSLGLLRDGTLDGRLNFWASQVKRTHEVYGWR